MNHKILSLLIAPLTMAMALSCRPRGFHSARTLDGEDAPQPPTFAALSKGLLALPGSAPRMKLAEELKALLPPLLASFSDGGDPQLAKEQRRTRHIIQQTLDYLASPQGCSADTKIRLYRGVGKGGLYGENAPGKGFALYGPLGGRVTDALKQLAAGGTLSMKPLSWSGELENGLPKLDGDERGTLAIQHADKLSTVTFPSPEFLRDMGRGRGMRIATDGPEDGRESDEKIELSLDRLFRDHSANSAGSPFLSTTLATEVAQTYAPGMLILEVCPSRAVLNTSTSYTFEQEYLIPFFILPEEIVGFEKHSCAFAIDHETLKPPEHCTKPILDDAPVNQVTQVLRNCYTNDRMLKPDPIAVFFSTTRGKLDIEPPPTSELLASQLKSQVPDICPGICTKTRTKSATPATEAFTGASVELEAGTAVDILRLDWSSELPEESDVLARVMGGPAKDAVVNIPGPALELPPAQCGQ